MLTLKHTKLQEESTEPYILIVDSKGSSFEVRPRCLGNFKDYIVIGLLEATETFKTYVLFATENLPEFYLTQWLDKENPPINCGTEPFKEEPNDILVKAINIRAKDIKYRILKD